MNSGKKWIVIGICLVFMAGLFAGIVIERKCLNCRRGQPEERREKFSKKDALDRLAKDLSLSSAQRAAVDRIFEKHRPEFAATHEDISKKLEMLRGRMDKEISGVLNDQQKEKYEDLMKERKKRRGEDRRR